MPTAAQHFAIPIDISEFKNSSTRRVAVRINSNWGDANEICVHEINLHGKFMDKPKQFAIWDAEREKGLWGVFRHG